MGEKVSSAPSFFDFRTQSLGPTVLESAGRKNASQKRADSCLPCGSQEAEQEKASEVPVSSSSP